MKLVVDNRTGYLNDYYFQMMCLLYFPGEKFRAGDTGENYASFYLAETEKHIFEARVTLGCGDKSAKAEFVGGYTPAIPMDDDFYAMNAVGKAFLEAGRRLFGFELPWGYIIGLRPVKRAKFYLDRGYSSQEVINLFHRDYEVSQEKSLLSVETAALQQKMLADIKPNDCGFYVSIPFCPTRCDYCSFVSYSNQRLFSLIPQYLEKLMQDIKETGDIIKRLGMNVRSIYIGGGTPSILEPHQINRLLGCISENVDINSQTEYTFEAGRPDTVTKEKLLAVKENGVGRISINPQTTNDKVLENIGRKHTAKQFFDAAETALSVGFDVLNSDLIAGLPGDTEESFNKSLEDVIGLGFSNITVHTLSIKNAAAMRFMGDGFYDPQGEFARNCVSYANNRLKQGGYMPYYLYRQKNTVGNAENTGYTLAGKENLYNVLMMEEHSTVFACGAGAITKLVSPERDEILRHPFPKYPFEYLDDNKPLKFDEADAFFKQFRKEDFN
ncbi:MAG: coproporphyrinogen dehydrogenase HemZ [Ruminococcaceae bacterium]|nr:coproporphyrinogen dehydrogenase HemZ [Oscillospiraceae bacterium]